MKVFVIEWLTMNTKKPYKERRFGMVYTMKDKAQEQSKMLCKNNVPCLVVEFKEVVK
tara:strand:- start:680 stop:850 length:171 start_codon:yes stop_codon:yes gene_type:complete